MKWFSRIAGLVACLAVCAILLILFLPSLNDFKTQGDLTLPGLDHGVTLQRDSNGMAYIHAQTLEDVFMAQGFVTAQDRLFQMQLTRLFAQGRICELAGPVAKNLDIRMRTIGLHRMAQKQARLLDTESRRYVQKYVDGINAFIEQCPKDIPLEFKLAGIPPEKWEIEDSLSILYYMGYSTSANLKTEITAQMLLETLGYEKAALLLPLNINPDDPLDTGSSKMPPKDSLSLTASPVETLAALAEDRQLRAGSNNWAISPDLSATGSPILAGDPHLDPRILPGVWYPVGLITPTMRAVGAQIPGIPGMVVGRTDHFALSMTNSYGDMLDLYIETLDPENPEHYMEGTASIPFSRVEETLRIKDKKSPDGFREEKIVIRSTRRGPVVSDIFPDLKTKKTITLRFAPAESMGASVGLTEILTATDSNTLVKALHKVRMVCLNWVFADTSGNIGHTVSGWIPVRLNRDGTFPFPVKDETDNWHGWLPQKEMPGRTNPPENWVGTCNHKTVAHDYPYYYSSYFSPTYRYNRLKELMAEPGKKSVDDFWQFQRDTKNMMAQNLSPIMAKALMSHDDTRDLGKILSQWNYMDDPDQSAPAIFQTTYRFFATILFEAALGKEKAPVLLNNWYFWQERLGQKVLENDTPWFNALLAGNPASSGAAQSPSDSVVAELFHSAGIRTKDLLTAKMGKDPEKWQWGTIHTLELVNPIRRKGPGKALLGFGPAPMGGSGETLYRGMYNFDDPYAVVFCAALRMVADLSDKDKILAVLPGGVTGRTFNSHQKDQAEAFMSGEKQFWWFSDEAISQNAKSKLNLAP